MKTSIIIVNYNAGAALKELVDSLAPETRDDVEAIVVDNASDDDSMELIKDCTVRARTIMNGENLGFAKGANQGIGASSGKYILLLNPDVVVRPGALKELESALDEDERVGIAGGKIFGPDGGFQLACRRGFPTPWVSFCRLSGLSFRFPKSRTLARYNLTYLDENEANEADAVSGSFMMIRKAALAETGHFDEDYFLYAEDIDLCYRVKKAGWKVVYTPAAVITHKKRVSARKNPVRSSYEFYNTMWTFHRKHYKKSTFFLVNACIYCAVSFLKYFVPSVVFVKSKLGAGSGD